MFCDVQYWPEILVQGFDAVAVTLHECGFLKPFNFFFCLDFVQMQLLQWFYTRNSLRIAGNGKEEGKDWCNAFAELRRFGGFVFMEVGSVCCPQIIGFFVLLQHNLGRDYSMAENNVAGYFVSLCLML